VSRLIIRPVRSCAVPRLSGNIAVTKHAGFPFSRKKPGCALDELEDGTYQFIGETPHGGVRALFYFKDNAGNQVSKYDAIHVEIHELDEAGMLVTILYGMVDPEGMIYLKKSSSGDAGQ